MTNQTVTPSTTPAAPVDTSLNALALASLITSVAGVGLLGVILGHVARKQIRRSGQRGSGVALAGLVVGYVSIAAAALLIAVLAVDAPATSPGTAAGVTAPTGAFKGGGIQVGAEGVGSPNRGAPTVEVYADFMCPYCRQFDAINGQVLDELASTGEATVVYHDVSFLDVYSNGTNYSTRAAHAAAVVADAAPEQFVAFHTALFAHMPEQNSDGLSDLEIAEIARASGVPPEIAGTFTDGQFTDWVAVVSNQANRDLSPPAVPTILINREPWIGNWNEQGALRAAVLDALPNVA